MIPTDAGAVACAAAWSGEAAPAAADVEHPLALLQRQLAADQVELRLLRLLQRRRPVARRRRSCRSSTRRGRARRTRCRRRSGGGRPRASRSPRVAPAAQPDLLGRRARRRPENAQAQGSRQHGAPSSGRRRRCPGRVSGSAKRSISARPGKTSPFEVDVTGDVRPGETQLVRRPQQPPQGTAAAEDDLHRRVGRPVGAAVPAPHPNRGVAPERGVDQGTQDVGGGHRSTAQLGDGLHVAAARLLGSTGRRPTPTHRASPGPPGSGGPDAGRPRPRASPACTARRGAAWSRCPGRSAARPPRPPPPRTGRPGRSSPLLPRPARARTRRGASRSIRSSPLVQRPPVRRRAVRGPAVPVRATSCEAASAGGARTGARGLGPGAVAGGRRGRGGAGR